MSTKFSDEEMDVEIKKYLDEVYKIGFKNGGIHMKNRILKSINRDWRLVTNVDLLVKLMKKINKIKP